VGRREEASLPGPVRSPCRQESGQPRPTSDGKRQDSKKRAGIAVEYCAAIPQQRNKPHLSCCECGSFAPITWHQHTGAECCFSVKIHAWERKRSASSSARRCGVIAIGGHHQEQVDLFLFHFFFHCPTSFFTGFHFFFFFCVFFFFFFFSPSFFFYFFFFFFFDFFVFFPFLFLFFFFSRPPTRLISSEQLETIHPSACEISDKITISRDGSSASHLLHLLLPRSREMQHNKRLLYALLAGMSF